MGKGLQIANTHGWTVERLQNYEKTLESIYSETDCGDPSSHAGLLCDRSGEAS